MNNIFERLFDVSSSTESLDNFLNENIQSLNDFYNLDYSHIAPYTDSINRYILFKEGVFHDLDFEKSYNRAFVLILLDLCERFNLIAATPRICSILKTNNINIGQRLQAALSYLYPSPKSNSDLVDKFDFICEKIQESIEIEEDNNTKSIITFLNYYAIVINDTRLEFVEQVRSKVLDSIKNNKYTFLNDEHISDVISIDLQNTTSPFSLIQEIINKLFHKRIIEQVIPNVLEDVLIETDTDYSIDLSHAEKSFDSIRALSVRQSDGSAFTNRGVKILESQKEMFAYMRRVGNMHEAKLKDALELIPKEFPTKIKLIDWGCGQGLASMVFLEKFGSEIVSDILLIEPSSIALKRATLHIRKFAPLVQIKTICKKLDELKEVDVKSKETETTIHLFSNILDIDEYSQDKLTELIKMTQSNLNYFVCVSPYIDDIKTERLDSFKRYFARSFNDSFSLLLETTTTKSIHDPFWLCNNNRSTNNISHGLHRTCQGYTESGGCFNRWTRVTRVFKANL